MMSKELFHERLRENLRRQPFVPFLVELSGGREILVRRPPIVFSDGAASFIDFDGDGALVDFFHHEVDSFRPAPQEIGS